jgi:hypothetical protein
MCGQKHNSRIKTVHFAHSTAQELRTCAAFYAGHWAFMKYSLCLFGFLLLAAPATSGELDPFFSEPHNAAAASLGQTNFFIGRMGRECFTLLQKPESWMHDLVKSWQDRNAKYYVATQAYLLVLVKETERVKGKEAADRTVAAYTAAVTRDGEGAVADAFAKVSKLEMCKKIVGLIDAGAFDVNSKHPFFTELERLANVAK